MAKTGRQFSKKSWLRLLLLAAVVALAVCLIRGCESNTGPDLRKAEGREAYIRSLGWEIDPASETHKSVRIPDPLTEVLEHYNEIQQKQGLALTGHLGESCEQYCYTVTNYPDEEETVQISLYTQGRELIAGDVHSTALRGFMQGLQKEP